MRRCLNEFAPPRQLRRWVSFLITMRYLVKLFVVVLLLLVAEQPIAACSCGEISTRKQFRSANAVFVGQVSTIKPGNNSTAARYGYPHVATFTILQSWKGAHGSEFSIYFDPGLSGCSVNFHEGGKYLVYVSHQADYWFDPRCSRTSPVDGSKDLRKLNHFWYRLFARIVPF
jgi:hypothetical protein